MSPWCIHTGEINSAFAKTVHCKDHVSRRGAPPVNQHCLDRCNAHSTSATGQQRQIAAVGDESASQPIADVSLHRNKPPFRARQSYAGQTVIHRIAEPDDKMADCH
jgi:hypothetical protein